MWFIFQIALGLMLFHIAILALAFILAMCEAAFDGATDIESSAALAPFRIHWGEIAVVLLILSALPLLLFIR